MFKFRSFLFLISTDKYKKPPHQVAATQIILVPSSHGMQSLFDPSGASKKKELAASKRTAQEKIKIWVMEALPDDIKTEVEASLYFIWSTYLLCTRPDLNLPNYQLITCREFLCGDPKCAPIDTALQVVSLHGRQVVAHPHRF